MKYILKGVQVLLYSEIKKNTCDLPTDKSL